MGFLAKEFPQMVDGYDRLYTGAYAKSEYVSSVRAMISVLQDRYDLKPRTRGRPGQTDPVEDVTAEKQRTLEWDHNSAEG